MKIKRKDLLLILALCLIWLAISNVIQALKCPKMTEIELFLHLPKSFILQFNQCKQ